MITVFNRCELISTFDTAVQAKVREILAQNNIDYKIKVIDRKSPSPFAAGSRARTGTFGEDLQYNCEYTIFVRKSDFDRAGALISK